MLFLRGGRERHEEAPFSGGSREHRHATMTFLFFIALDDATLWLSQNPEASTTQHPLGVLFLRGGRERYDEKEKTAKIRRFLQFI